MSNKWAFYIDGQRLTWSGHPNTWLVLDVMIMGIILVLMWDDIILGNWHHFGFEWHFLFSIIENVSLLFLVYYCFFYEETFLGRSLFISPAWCYGLCANYEVLIMEWFSHHVLSTESKILESSNSVISLFFLVLSLYRFSGTFSVSSLMRTSMRFILHSNRSPVLRITVSLKLLLNFINCWSLNTRRLVKTLSTRQKRSDVWSETCFPCLVRLWLSSSVWNDGLLAFTERKSSQPNIWSWSVYWTV